MGILRKHIQHAKTFQERLTEEAQRLKGLAEQTPDGKTRELLLKRARQAETVVYGQLAFVSGIATDKMRHLSAAQNVAALPSSVRNHR
jgi:hypothetical protein